LLASHTQFTVFISNGQATKGVIRRCKLKTI